MPDTKLLISCVGENNALYNAEVLLLFKTIRKFGGKIATSNSKLVANFVKSIDPTIKQNLKDLGVNVRVVEPFESRSPTSNKIRMLEIDDYDYDVLIALDCDTAVVQDFSSEIDPEFFQAMPADVDLLTVQQWRTLFSVFNWEPRPEIFNNTRKSIIPYFNSGVLLIPNQYVKQIRKSWHNNISILFEYYQSSDELLNKKYFFEEIALSLTIGKEKIPSKMLKLEMNFSIQSITGHLEATRSLEPDLMLDDISPFIFHYHHRYDLDGLLAKSGYKKPDLAIERINKLILLDSSWNDKNITTERSTVSEERISIATDAMVLQKVSLAEQKVIEERERMMISMDDQLKKALKEVETLQNINVEIQKILEQKDLELKKALKELETMQDINLGHEKTIGENAALIQQLDTQLKRANKDVHWLQSINLNQEKIIEEKDNRIKELSK